MGLVSLRSEQQAERKRDGKKWMESAEEKWRDNRFLYPLDLLLYYFPLSYYFINTYVISIKTKIF